MEGECVNQFPEQNGDILIGRYIVASNKECPQFDSEIG
jgi:hypothetical protein